MIWYSEWSTIQRVIVRVISNLKIEITSTWIVRNEVQLLINRNYNKIREKYDSGHGINYLTGWHIQLLS